MASNQIQRINKNQKVTLYQTSSLSAIDFVAYGHHPPPNEGRSLCVESEKDTFNDPKSCSFERYPYFIEN